MATVILLYLLATVDGALIGYRLAAGQSALVDKGGYFVRSMVRGVLLVQPVIALAAFMAILLLLVASDPGRLTQELVAMGQRMLEVYVPYAILVLGALALRTIPSVGVRVATSVIVLGPATAARPYVVIAGVLWAGLASLRPEIWLAATLLACLMLAIEPLLQRRVRTA